MKLVKQIVLGFREGTSDKVYEVDLCELGPDRFVVNFRFGRRGAALKDGSKTPLPVSRKEADRVFDALVKEKTAKGYKEGAPTPEEVPAVAVDPSAAEDPRERALLEILGGRKRSRFKGDHLIWRIGELRVRAALPALLPMLVGATDRRTWHVVRALLRLADPGALPTLWAVWESPQQPAHVRALAAHAIGACCDSAEGDRFRRRLLEALPGNAREAWDRGDVDALLALCPANPDLPDRLYALAEPHQAPIVAALLRRVPFADPTFLGVRRACQAAEARSDGIVWGVLARRLDVEKPSVRRIKRRRSGGVAGAWSPSSRSWWRRRAWRTLHRLGEAGSADYVAMAAGLLGEVTDADARQVAAPRPPPPPQFRTGRDPRTGQVIQIPIYQPPPPVPRHAFGHLWVFGHVVWAHSPTRRADRRSLTWRVSHGSDSARAEAFPTLWDQRPDALAGLLGSSGCSEVHAFASKALRANRPAWASLPVADLVAWFASPYPDTVQLAAEVAVTRYDPRDPDTGLVAALLGCPVESARDLAGRWVRENPAPFLRDSEFLIGIVLSPSAHARRVALEVLGAASLPAERARVLVETVVDRALRADPADPGATDRFRDAAAVLVTAFATELHALPLDLVARLVAHPVAGAAELGAKALLGHRVRPPELPDDLLAAAMTSPHPVVRGIGIRLYGELPDAVLAERFRVLLALVASGHADVRASARPIVARLAGSNPAFGRVFLGALLPTLVGPGPEDLHADLVSLLRDELRDTLSTLDTAGVLRVVRAESTRVQELGGELLRTQVDPGDLAPGQVATLAGSDVLAVRRTAWLLLDAQVDAVRAAPDTVLQLVDAPWQDSREFAFRYVREKVGPEHLGPAVAIAVCDSVRPDVQAFGRTLVGHLFTAEDGPRYLQMLAQHPDAAMQLHASAWLEDHAAGDAGRLNELVPFLVAILQRPNRAKAAKLRVLAFLAKEAVRDEASARVVARVMVPLSLSAAKTHREAAIGTLAAIRAAFPEVPTGLRVVEPPVREAARAV